MAKLILLVTLLAVVCILGAESRPFFFGLLREIFGGNQRRGHYRGRYKNSYATPDTYTYSYTTPAPFNFEQYNRDFQQIIEQSNREFQQRIEQQRAESQQRIEFLTANSPTYDSLFKSKK